MSILACTVAVLWVGLLVVALAGCLNRWFDPVPGRRLILLGVVLAICWAAIGVGLPSDRLLAAAPLQAKPSDGATAGNPLHDDLLYKIVPAVDAQLGELKAGRWPLWNPWAGAGMPLLADPQAQPLQPLVLALAPLAPATVPSGLMILKLAIALIFGYLLLCRLGLSDASAVLGTSIHGFGGFLILWWGWPIATTAAVLPAVLYAVDRLLDSRDAPGTGRQDSLLLLITGLTLALAGHPESILHASIVVVVFAICRGPKRLWKIRSSKVRPVVVGRLVGASLLIAGLAAPVLWPTLDYLPQSRRAVSLEVRNTQDGPASAGGGLEQQAELSKNLAGLVAPNALGNGRFGAYWGSVNTNEDSSGFAGTLTLLAALLAFTLPGRRFPCQRSAGLGILISGLLALQPSWLVAFLSRTPGFDISATSHRRATMVLVLGLSYLAAIACQRLIEWSETTESGGDRGASRLPWRVLGLATGVAVLVIWAYGAHPDPSGAHRLDRLRPAFLALQLGALGLGCAVMVRMLRRGRARDASPAVKPRSAILVLALIAVVELGAIHGAAWWWSIASRTSAYYPSAEILERLEKDLGTGRMAALGETLRPNVATVYRMADARIDNPMSPARYNRLVGGLYGDGGRTAGRFTTADHPVFDLMGVRFLLTDPESPPPPGSELVERRSGAALWRRPKALERLFLPAAAVRVDGGERWRPVDANDDFALLAGVDRMPLGDSWRAVRSALGGPLDRLEILTVEPARISAQLFARQPRLMASSVYQDGGWRGLLDGQRLESVTTNALFVGAWLSPPASGSTATGRIEWIYRPRRWLEGWWLAALAGAFALAAFVRCPDSLRL